MQRCADLLALENAEGNKYCLQKSASIRPRACHLRFTNLVVVRQAMGLVYALHTLYIFLRRRSRLYRSRLFVTRLPQKIAWWDLTELQHFAIVRKDIYCSARFLLNDYFVEIRPYRRQSSNVTDKFWDNYPAVSLTVRFPTYWSNWLPRPQIFNYC